MQPDSIVYPGMSTLTRILQCPQKKSIYRIINPSLFDVSLRDGIQSANPVHYPTNIKRDIFRTIFHTYYPDKMEIGSIVSPKVLPIMADTVDLHEYVMDYLEDKPSATKPFVLVPNHAYLKAAIHSGMYHFSFITSVSNAFQLKNTRKTIDEVKRELKEMEETLNCYQRTHHRKLYISCIDECPLTGKIDHDFIVREILYYHTHYDFSEICLSDTMGTLTSENFKYIIDTIRVFGIPTYKLSLHLHMSETNQDDIRRMIWHCFDKGIRKFDVSFLTEGGCSVTMGKQALSNLTYDYFYEVVDKYIERKIDRDQSA